MTALTEESLTAALERLAEATVCAEQRILLRPTHLIIPPAMLRRLMHRPPLAKRRGPRGRRLAFKFRAQPALWRFGL